MKGRIIRRSGGWSLVVDVGKDPQTGKRRQHREQFRIRRDAERRLAELVAQAAKGSAPAKRNVTFSSYAEQWLDARNVRDNTRQNYQSALNTAGRVFGAVPLTDVTRADVQRLVRQFTDAGRSKATLGFVLFVVRAVFMQAVDDGVLVRNPAARVPVSGRAACERQAFSPDELATLRAYVADDWLSGCWVLTLCGLRRSEILGLRWGDDVDLSTGTLSVDHAVVADVASGKRNATPTPPKTRRGKRVLPLPPDVLAALRAMRERHAAVLGLGHVRGAAAGGGLLAVDESGVPLRPARYSTLWRQLCTAAGVSPLPLHSARHSSVSAMRAAGVPDDVVARWHGHDEVVMRRVYSHPDAERLAAAGVALADVLAKAAPMA